MKRLHSFISLGMVAAVLLLFPGPPREAFAVEEIRSVPLKEQFRKVLEVDPENPALRFYRGVALLHDGQPGKKLSVETPHRTGLVGMSTRFATSSRGLAGDRTADSALQGLVPPEIRENWHSSD